MTTPERFDAQLQAVDADDSYDTDFVVVEGLWTDGESGRIGPAALTLDPKDVTFGADNSCPCEFNTAGEIIAAAPGISSNEEAR